MGKARVIYTEACDQIAAALAQDGFLYRKSKRVLVKQNGDLTFEISFQSSFRNFVVPDSGGLLQRAVSSLPSGADLIAFGDVRLIVHAAVRSKAIQRWRASLQWPLGVDDLVTGGQVGNLQARCEWMEFKLANPHRRERVIRDAIDLIRSVALPYLVRFSDPQHVIEGLLSGTVPWHWEPSALEYASCFGTAEQARDLLRNYLRRYPEQMDEYRARVREYPEHGIPEAFDSGAPGRLAKAALSLGLDPF